MALEVIRYSKGKLEIIDQLLLPMETKFISVKDTEDGWKVIRNMQVRGAPAIGVVGALSLAAELYPMVFASTTDLLKHVESQLNYLVTARPTAVNMADTAIKITALAKTLHSSSNVEDMKTRIISALEVMIEDDINTNKKMGQFGAESILSASQQENVKLLTHCNTGSLATAGYGTALGVVRAIHGQGKLDHCYCTETRPYNQGARLTAYELVYEKMPSTLICDSMASMLMQKNKISAVLVGADRIVANGDTANKIGTYQLAIVAQYHNVPFYVVAPSTSIDLTLESGDQIVIEERPHNELTDIKGVRIAAPGVGVWNPAFDVTPEALITGGIVTEFGVYKPHELKEKLTAELASKKT